MLIAARPAFERFTNSKDPQSYVTCLLRNGCMCPCVCGNPFKSMYHARLLASRSDHEALQMHQKQSALAFIFSNVLSPQGYGRGYMRQRDFTLQPCILASSNRFLHSALGQALAPFIFLHPNSEFFSAQKRHCKL